MSEVAVEQSIASARFFHFAGRLPHAEAICRQILAASPRDGEALYLLGLVCFQSGKIDEAIDAFGRAAIEFPRSADVFCNLGVVMQKGGRLEDAIAAYKHALTLKPDSAEAFNNFGMALVEKGYFNDAIMAYRRALSIKPDYAAAHYNLGLALLMQGDLEDGWSEHEWRLQVNELNLFRPSFPQPQWHGEELRGKKILVYDEQGAGDAIQFARYLPHLSERGGKVILGCHPNLLRLMRSVNGISRCVTRPDEAGDFDVHCSLLSLPRMFNTTLKTIPNQPSYLRADETMSQKWQRRIAGNGPSSTPRLKVGLTWAGRPEHRNDHNRSMPLELFAPLAQIKGIELFSLQKGPAARQISSVPVGMKLTDWSAELEDFAETAALVHNLDLIITVDTSIAHLAGAMGKPVWVLLPFVPDWRWLLDRNDSPWYPTMKLFRQPAVGDWQTPIRKIFDSICALEGSAQVTE